MTRMIKRILKIVGIVSVCLIGAVLLFAAFLLINGHCPQTYEGADPALSDWMGRVDGSAPLNRIAIPGAHDAGTAGVFYAGETQTYTVGEQLASGARYFDIRVRKREDGSLHIYHDIINGGPFDEVMDEITDFITAHPTEVLLLDFQHFDGGSQQDVLDILRARLYDAGLAVENTRGEELMDHEYLRALSLDDVRGKCVVLWGDRSPAYDEVPWLFLRNNDDCSDEYRCLDSYYLGDLHKAGTDALIGEAFPIYFETLHDRIDRGEDALFVLQCQLTDGRMIFGPWSKERAHDRRMTAYIDSLGVSAELPYINVVMRDFLTPEKCEQIIELNVEKGIMKP